MVRQTAAATAAQQLELFAGLAAPARQKRVRWVRQAPAAAPLFEQLVFDLRPPPVWVDPDDVPEEGDYPEHRWARAIDCEPPKTRAPASIWDLGAVHAADTVLSGFRLRPKAAKASAPDDIPVVHRRVVREFGVTRHIAMREQETDEWKAKETARRARQKLPKPPKQTFKLRNKEPA